MPMTANLASVESIGEPPPPSSSGVVTGSTREESMQAPMAAANGASFENSALHVLYLVPIFFLVFGDLLLLERKEGLRLQS